MRRSRQIKFLAGVTFVILITVAVIVALLTSLIESNKVAVFDKNGQKANPPATTTTTTRATSPPTIPIHRIVNTECGKVQGTAKLVLTDDNQTTIVYEYIGIPYAEPPVNNLRWKPPVRLTGDKCWKGTFVANKTVYCKQFNYFQPKPLPHGQEDCLLLSVRSPRRNVSSKLPVLVWIHGGALLYNQGDQVGYHPNAQMTASINVVSVTINYRVGPFGFLLVKEILQVNGSFSSYGNLGYMDQILALEWIKRNIEKFGGDPNRITLYGHSGGGVSVNALLASPLNNNLFSRAISSSGLINAIFYEEAMKEHRSIVYKSNCNRSTDAEIRSCFYNLAADQILYASPWAVSLYHVFAGAITFPANGTNSNKLASLVYTDPLVFPRSLPIKNTKVQVLISNTAEETAIFPSIFFGTNNFSLEFLTNFLTPRMQSFSSNNLFKRALGVYPPIGGPVIPEYIYHAMTTDVLSTCDTNIFAKNLSRFLDVYKYILLQQPTNPQGHLAYHGFDAFAVFGYGTGAPGFVPKSDDWKLTYNLRKVFKEFIYFGIPDKTWAKYPNMTAQFVNNTVSYINGEYHKNKCKFWAENGLLGRFGIYQ